MLLGTFLALPMPLCPPDHDELPPWMCVSSVKATLSSSSVNLILHLRDLNSIPFCSYGHYHGKHGVEYLGGIAL